MQSNRKSPSIRNLEDANSSRKSPSTQTLAANGIKIRRHEWPKQVLFLASQLLEPFSNLVPLSKLGCEWDEANIPQDAFFLDESPKLRREREKMIDSALAIKRKCRSLMQHNIVDEASWNEIWTNATRDHIIETELENHGKGNHHTLSRRDNMLFSKTGRIYNNDKYDCAKLRGCMENKCFDQGILKALRKSGLISSPFSEKHDVCFPWGVYEGKSRKRGKLDPESQAANAGVACIKILEHLAKGPSSSDKNSKTHTKVPDPPEEYKTSGRDILPIPCITCHAEVWELWVCYRSNDDCTNPTYELEKILGGDMSDLWSCVQLVYILERLRNWALDTFRPWVHRYLVPWIEHCGLDEKKSSRLPNKNVKLYPGSGNGFGGSLDDSGYCTGDDSGEGEGEVKVEYEDDDDDEEEESPYYDYERGNILPEMLTRRTPKKEGGLGNTPTRQKYSPLIDSQLEQIPKIEKVYSGDIETAALDPRTNKIKEYIFYHAKWKDCWVTREYIARSPEKFAGAKIRRTNRVIRHGWPVELYFIQFEEVRMHKDKLNKDERKLARREAGA